MSDCKCIRLENGLPDVFGFNYFRQNCVVVFNGTQNPVELCENGHRLSPGATWMITKDLYEMLTQSGGRDMKVLAKFGAKQQLLKS